MKNHREMFEALLAGEELIDNKGNTLSCNDTLRFNCNIHNPLINPFQYVFHHSDPENWEIKPKTININEFEVPGPVKNKLEKGTEYWVPFLNYGSSSEHLVENYEWDDDEKDNSLLELGLVHLDRENAELHTKALLSFTSKET